MPTANQAAAGGQPELHLGSAGPVRLLHFSATRSGRFFIDLHGDHVFQIRRPAAGWSGSPASARAPPASRSCAACSAN
jgi:hypothetical protein